MHLSVIGSGYVGLVAGTCFADSGNDVTCVDIDQRKIDNLNRGVLPIYEPGLEEMVEKNVKEGRLSFSTDLPASVSRSQVVFIAVGTPEGEYGDADLQYVLAAARAIGKALTGYTVVVDKSTVPVGTADKVRAAIAGETTHPFDVVSNPEFLKEGAAIDDFLKPDRVVIGADTEKARDRHGRALRALRAHRATRSSSWTSRSAELTKYAANAMLATRISFMNEIASALREGRRRRRPGAQGHRLRLPHRLPLPLPRRRLRRLLLPQGRQGARRHRPRDTASSSTSCAPSSASTSGRSARWCEKVARALRRRPGRQARSRVWGLAFKPKTDDMREAPARRASSRGCSARAPRCAPSTRWPWRSPRRALKGRVDPGGAPLRRARGRRRRSSWSPSGTSSASPDFERMKALMKSPVVFDGRNIYSPAKMREMGFTYFGIGRS